MKGGARLVTQHLELYTFCQSVGSEDAEAHGKQREGVDEVHAEVEDALEQHHHEPELHDTTRPRSQKQTHPTADFFGGLKSEHRLVRLSSGN